jgi:hypothetical protein
MPRLFLVPGDGEALCALGRLAQRVNKLSLNPVFL